MPDYLHYQKSISNEIISVKDRVRNFLDNHHWGEDGRYKEIILSSIIQKQLPSNLSVGTGFVMCSLGNGAYDITSQIDIIVYDNRFPILFSIENFVVVPHDSVVGIIEVKTKLTHYNFNETIKKHT